MIAIHRGGGMVVPLYGILSALLINVLFYKVMGNSDYYDEHLWPKLSVLIVAGFLCLVTGLLLKRQRVRHAGKERSYLDSRVDVDNQLSAIGPRDHLMFIPVQYWSLAYFGATIVYAVVAAQS